MLSRYAALPFILIALLCLAAPQHSVASAKSLANAGKPATKKIARKPPTPSYHLAFQMMEQGKSEDAFAFSQRGPDPALNLVLRAQYMAQPGNTISFEEMSRFIDNNPDWPNVKGIMALAEQKLPANLPNGQVVAWFREHPPQTVSAFYRYMDALTASGNGSQVAPFVLARWINGDFNAEDLSAFHTRYDQYIDGDANWARLDRLLWKNDATGARYAMNYVGDDMKAVAEARLALENQSLNAGYYLDHVPVGWQRSPGILYQRLRYFIRGNKDDEAVDLLLHAPSELGKPEAWWEQRQIEVYRLIHKRNYAAAYQMAAENGQTEPKQIAQAEFLAGWLALRFLNQPDDARQHFQALSDSATTPMTRARASYWLGRTYETLNDRNNAEQAYETAAALNLTYYGQLAMARLYPNATLRLSPEPVIPQATRQAFYARNSTKAIQHLHAINEDDLAKAFYRAASDAAQRRADFVLLAELGYAMRRPDLAIQATKAANQKNMLIGAAGFPLLNHGVPTPPEAAFTHALIRQESMFNPDARSPVGAHGLMQLMRGTAADVARKLDIKFVEDKLGNPDYNLKLGTSFVQQQITAFNGSYVLALAGYNAGPRRVRDWMALIGDPRTPEVDDIDWVEEIPLSETRNYVQRIIEGLQVYRARLNGGTAPLLIVNDLRR